jgi:hypothetical protein
MPIHETVHCAWMVTPNAPRQLRGIGGGYHDRRLVRQPGCWILSDQASFPVLGNHRHDISGDKHFSIQRTCPRIH